MGSLDTSPTHVHQLWPVDCGVCGSSPSQKLTGECYLCNQCFVKFMDSKESELLYRAKNAGWSLDMQAKIVELWLDNA